MFCVLQICGSPEDEATMLLCDICDRGYHMQCLDPPLQQVMSMSTSLCTMPNINSSLMLAKLDQVSILGLLDAEVNLFLN